MKQLSLALILFALLAFVIGCARLTPIAALPTNTTMPATATPAQSTSDPNSLASIAGTYMYKYPGIGDLQIWLRSDGTYTNLAGFGTFAVTPDQVTFVDTQPASGTTCNSDPGIYKWSMDNNKLTFVPVKDNCKYRAGIFGTNTFHKVPADPSTPVEFIWRITGAPNDFLRLGYIAIDGQSNIYIVDGGNDRIQKFDTNGKFLTMWGSKGDGDGQFVFRVFPNHFGAVAVDGAGNVYVTDYNSRVQKFDSNGKFLSKWGSPGSGDGQFAPGSHSSIAVDTLGNVYVADTDNYRIQKFDSNGKFLLKWGSEGKGNGEFGTVLIGDGPEGIAVDGQGNVYVADPANYRIEKFDNNGNFLNTLGSQGTADGQFVNVAFVAVDQQGSVYVTDNQQNVGGDTNQVQKFDSNGKFLMKWGETGTDLGEFNYPGGIVVDKQGNIYVTDEEDVQKFKPQ